MNTFSSDYANLLSGLTSVNPSLWMPADLQELEEILPDGQHCLHRHQLETSLYAFVRTAWPNIETAEYVDNWHIGAVCEHLQAVTDNQISKLLINIPPGCSKSLLVCVFWPMWEWARNPAIRWFFASYDQRLSTRDSVRCRALIKSPWYQQLWGSKYELTHDQNQKLYYETDKGGYRLATTIRGHGTGEHPDRIVVDDPHNVEQAESEVERQSTLDWWDLTMTTRGVSREARRVIIMQRLHHGDLAGHVLSKGDWVHICLPMRYEKQQSVDKMCNNLLTKDIVSVQQSVDRKSNNLLTNLLGWQDPRTTEGELLTPQQFSEVVVNEMEKNLGAYGTAGQLQQRPTPREGGMFKEEWFNQRRKASPYHARRIRYWDRAATEGAGCYTAGVLLSIDEQGNYYVENVVRGQWEPDRRNEVMLAVAQRDRNRYGPTDEPAIYVEAEGGSSGRDAWKGVARALAGFPVREDKVTGKKEVRAEPWACLVGPTLVLTKRGQVPIYEVTTLDEVIDRHGQWHRILWAGMSGITDQIVQLRLPNGYNLRGTVDHRIWTGTHGWVQLGDLGPDTNDFITMGPAVEGRVDRWLVSIPCVPVYDLMVEDSHEFFANGILVHNCQLASKNVYLIDNGESEGSGRADWDINAYVEEHCQFPLGKYLDQVDSSSGAFNLLTGSKMATPLRTFSLRYNRQKGLRLIVCDEQQLLSLRLEQRCLLISMGNQVNTNGEVMCNGHRSGGEAVDIDTNGKEVVPRVDASAKNQGISTGNGVPCEGSPRSSVCSLDKCLDTLRLEFLDLDPAELQEHWDESIALDLFTSQHGKALWKFLTKIRDPSHELIVLQDEGDRRALTLAYALCDMLGLQRKEAIYRVGQEEWQASHEDKPPNRYLFEMVKNCRFMVVG